MVPVCRQGNNIKDVLQLNLLLVSWMVKILVPLAGSTEEMKNKVAPGAFTVNSTAAVVTFSSTWTVLGIFENCGGSTSSATLN